MWPGMIRQRESVKRKFRSKKRSSSTDSWSLIPYRQMTVLDWGLSVGPWSYRQPSWPAQKWGRVDKSWPAPKYWARQRKDTNIQQQPSVRRTNPTWKVYNMTSQAWWKRGKIRCLDVLLQKKVSGIPKEYQIQSFLIIYTNSCKLYRSLKGNPSEKVI